MNRRSFLLFASAGALAAQSQSKGIFEGDAGIGASARPGALEFDSGSRTYRITGGGANMWGVADAFHFAWKRASGGLTLFVDVEFEGAGTDPHRKAGLIVRQDLDPASPYVDLVVHGDGLTSMQFREEAGAATREVRAPITGAYSLKLERKGDLFAASVARKGEDLQTAGEIRVQFKDPVYAGLAVCSHNVDVMETAIFRRLAIDGR